MIPFNGIKEEEIQVLRHLLPSDRANPFKELYNFDHEFAPRLRLNEPEFKNLLPKLYVKYMEGLDTYVSIEDLLNITLSIKHMDTHSLIRKEDELDKIGRYLYTQ